ncbi:hypothetical protein FB561_3120 [Kribbella amoyensis]|uniref:Uncharacterized protein n=1 Tax=Kribbella amoyensis TaxID=996641 RepID=A0A561BT08_9ACTN|nr:DUF6084 family protein [Kribbella amoyensis]TWD81996.1 hypothetical protein FB561_3120 [Kribbella amoyensis]
MVDLEFTCLGADSDRYAAAPTILLHLRVTETTGTPVHVLALRSQIRIEPVRRRYDDEEAAALADLFGSRDRWGETLKPLQFAFVSQLLPGFTGSTEVDLQLPCSYDFEVAAHKYLYGLREGGAPLLLLFNGTIFTGQAGHLAVTPVAWQKETRYELPVSVWRDAMDQHFPGASWLRLRRDTFDRLYAYRVREALPGWDDAIDRLLKEQQP